MFSIKILLIILLINILFFLSCEENKERGIVLIGNLLYEMDSTTVYSGKVSDMISGKKIEYEVKDGLKNGEMKIYHANGKLEMSGKMKNNLNEGSWKYFYPSGKLESEGYFVNDKAQGNWKWYYENGALREEGSYKDGNKNGNWKIYSAEGELKEIINFDTLYNKNSVDTIQAL